MQTKGGIANYRWALIITEKTATCIHRFATTDATGNIQGEHKHTFARSHKDKNGGIRVLG